MLKSKVLMTYFMFVLLRSLSLVCAALPALRRVVLPVSLSTEAPTALFASRTLVVSVATITSITFSWRETTLALGP